MLKTALLIVLALVAVLAIAIAVLSGRKSGEAPGADDVDPSTLVRMRTAPGVTPSGDGLLEDYSDYEDPYYTPTEGPDPSLYANELPDSMAEPGLIELLLDEDVPVEKKYGVIEELGRLGYEISFRGRPLTGGEGVLAEAVPDSEGGRYQAEDPALHPELAVTPSGTEEEKDALMEEIKRLLGEGKFPPELAIIASRMFERPLVLPERDDIQENYERVDAVLNSTDISGYDFSMFSEFCRQSAGLSHIDIPADGAAEGRRPAPAFSGEPEEGVVTTLPADDMSGDGGWDQMGLG